MTNITTKEIANILNITKEEVYIYVYPTLLLSQIAYLDRFHALKVDADRFNKSFLPFVNTLPAESKNFKVFLKHTGENKQC